MFTLLILGMIILLAATVLVLTVCSGGIIFVIFGADIALGVWIIVSIIKCFKRKKGEDE